MALVRTRRRHVFGAIIVALAFLVAVPVAISATSRAKVRTATSLESQLLTEINAVRTEHNLQPLRRSQPLATAAAVHARAMAVEGFFAHESSDGSVFWKRIQRYYASGGYKYWSVGENLAWASPDLDAEQTVAMWMKSAPHRANLLSKNWKEIGFSAVHAESASGDYGDQAATIVTADFGIRR